MRGASLKAVQELLGHESIEMTLRYSHLTPDVKREAVQLLDWAETARPSTELVEGSGRADDGARSCFDRLSTSGRRMAAHPELVEG